MSTNPIPAQCAEATELHKRIDRIIELIPKDFKNQEMVEEGLRKRQGSIPFTAPTAMGARWREVAQILEANLPDPNKFAWAAEIADVFGKEI